VQRCGLPCLTKQLTRGAVKPLVGLERRAVCSTRLARSVIVKAESSSGARDVKAKSVCTL
jgi:hypothetical protein